jgi:2,4-dienoyl-CoA reductase (NADPH2)
MFEALFQSGKIGSLHLKNRLIMAAMGNALADENGQVTQAMLDHYRTRAAGGVGLVTTQFVAISRSDIMPYNLALYDDCFMTGISRLIEEIHRQNIPVCIQLMHPGLLLLLIKSLPAEQTLKVPSLNALLPKDRNYREISAAEIESYVQDFVTAAQRVQDCGADAVEVHACHGCLLSSFLSPVLNRRSDLYGGSPENRARFVEQVVAGIKEKTGKGFPLIARINGRDDIPGGVKPDEVVKYAQILQSAGADAISISSGLEYWSTLMAPSYLTSPGVIIPISQQVKQKVSLPVIVAGKIPPALAEQAVSEGQTDFVAMGRPLLADPQLPDKLQAGELKEIAQCLYCNNCLRSSWRSCTVNPFLYRDSTFSIVPSGKPRKIMVIGGGLAGMQAAVLGKIKGHEVKLYEKETYLGGQWRIASNLPGKGGYAAIINYLKHQLEKYQVLVFCGCEVTKEVVITSKPDVVILATGAAPMGAGFPGLSGMKAAQANDIISGKVEVIGKSVVLGSTIVAMETAVLLASQGKEVILVSPGNLGGRKGPDDLITYRGLLRRILHLRVPLYLNSLVLEGAPKDILIRFGEEILSIPCDTLVLATGVQPVDKLAAELKGLGPEVYAIGDCMMSGNAAQATFSAARLIMKL